MHAGQQFSPSARDRAIDRLRSLTRGTIVASFAGAIGFGIVAAATQPGTAVDPVTPEVAPGVDPTPAPTIGTSQNHGSYNGDTPLQPPAIVPAPVKHHAHVSTGTS